MARLNLRQYSARLLIICCLLVAALGYFFWSPGLTAFSGSYSDTSQQDIVPQEMLQPVMGYSALPVMRDPFAVPQEFQQVAPVPVSSPPAKNYPSVPNNVLPSSAIPEISLELVGVVSGGGQKVAIIKSAGNSGSYQLKDYLGPYQLLSVGEKSVTLWGPQGEKVLILER
ncbi:hypothetical protein SPSIL_021020 [Sporomusa silvacetica DSM 10669]|uniref:Type II secretion system protein GspC N-terminal domain-containing protein n=1 Tax=Sporomusa silvacetica DSM 10669 TaxID=1123289 RepID=A0ABZ3IKL0_9FIRM|nr:hypothetical protein [Sporomusa silvacetica]OZC18646.1 hypothetical protein SPSIL_22550 [Sporomusa silvacetica DSM 10669]